MIHIVRSKVAAGQKSSLSIHCLLSWCQDWNEKKFHPSQTTKAMLLRASQCRVTWCLSPWKQAYLKGRQGWWQSWDQKQVRALGLWSWSSWEAVSFNLLTLMFRYSRQNQKCMARLVTLKLCTAKQIKLSESHRYYKVSVPETECWRCDWVEGLHLSAIRLHLREACAHRSQVWTWLGGEQRGHQFVIIWVTRCQTDMLPRWPPRRALKR